MAPKKATKAKAKSKAKATAVPFKLLDDDTSLITLAGKADKDSAESAALKKSRRTLKKCDTAESVKHTMRDAMQGESTVAKYHTRVTLIVIS
jgi:hypothetical protein